MTDSTFSRRNLIKTSAAIGALSATGLMLKDRSAKAQDSDVTLTFVVSATADSPQMALVEELFRQFESQHPGVKIENQVIPYDSFMPTLTTRVVGGQAPDCAWLLDRFATAMIGQKALLPLDDLLPAGYGDSFIPTQWNYAVADGQAYAIPMFTNVQTMLYNVDHFATAGITVPPTPAEAWLFPEVVEKATQLKEATGADYGLIHWPNSTPSRLSQYLVAAGGSVLTEDLSGPNLEDPIAIELLTQIQQTFESGLAPKDNWTDPDAMMDIFTSGNASMFLGSGNFQILEVNETVGDAFDWGFAYMPTTLGTPNELVIFNQTEHADVAAELIQFLASPEIMATICSTINVVPTRNDLSADSIEYAVRPDLMDMLQEQSTVASARIQNEMKLAAWSEIDLMLRDKLEQLALGSLSPEEVASQGSDEIVQLLARYAAS